MRKILLSGLVVAVFFGATLWALDTFWPPANLAASRPALKDPPPLKPVAQMSTVVLPVAVAHAAIRDAMEAQAPRDLAGKRDNPLPDLVNNGEIGWTMTRGPLAVAGRNDGLSISTPLTGQLRASGQLADQAAQLAAQLGSAIGGRLGREVNKLATKPFDHKLDLSGAVTLLARPALQPNWRIEPNLAANVSLAERTVSISGVRINATQEVKPLVDRAVDEQVARLQARLRNDPVLEQIARREWGRLCRSIALAPSGPNLPTLWLEVKPVRAVAAQPRVGTDAVVLTGGVHAETRIVPAETKPECPFPARLEIVPADQSKVAIAVPIDLPLAELSRILEAQIKGRTFPEDDNAPIRATVQAASLAASGDRLLISLKINARERKSWFGLGADADVHIWGRPSLDRTAQVLRFTDLALDVESQAAFGMAGAAARAAIPYLQAALEQRTAIDLKPLAAQAQKSIAAAIAEFGKSGDDVNVQATVTGLRLAGIEFDARTLRVFAEIDGAAKVTVSKLP